MSEHKKDGSEKPDATQVTPSRPVSDKQVGRGPKRDLKEFWRVHDDPYGEAARLEADIRSTHVSDANGKLEPAKQSDYRGGVHEQTRTTEAVAGEKPVPNPPLPDAPCPSPQAVDGEHAWVVHSLSRAQSTMPHPTPQEHIVCRLCGAVRP